jgi:hypothetical protein
VLGRVFCWGHDDRPARAHVLAILDPAAADRLQLARTPPTHRKPTTGGGFLDRQENWRGSEAESVLAGAVWCRGVRAFRGDVVETADISLVA